jgi:hypothetical protein
MDATMEEYQFIMKNDVWDIDLRLEGKLVVSYKRIYKIKHVRYGIIDKYKERFAARGFSHKEGAYYEETFSLDTKYTSIKTIIFLPQLWVGDYMRWM